MKKFHRFSGESIAKNAASVMECVCYLAMLLMASMMTMSFIGRQQFTLHTTTGTYEGAIYAEDNHNPHSRTLTLSIEDDNYFVTAYDGDKIDLITQIGISAAAAVHIIPEILCLWFMSRLFGNVRKGRIFIEKNAAYLMRYGLLQIAIGVILPFVKLFIGFLANQFTASQVQISSQPDLFNKALPSIAFIVAAYIIRYGIHLQDEADHTI